MLKAGLTPAFLLLVDAVRNVGAARKLPISYSWADVAENLGGRRRLLGSADFVVLNSRP